MDNISVSQGTSDAEELGRGAEGHPADCGPNGDSPQPVAPLATAKATAPSTNGSPALAEAMTTPPRQMMCSTAPQPTSRNSALKTHPIPGNGRRTLVPTQLYSTSGDGSGPVPLEVQQRERISTLLGDNDKKAAALEELQRLFEGLTRDYEAVSRDANAKSLSLESLQSHADALAMELQAATAKIRLQDERIARFNTEWLEKTSHVKKQYDDVVMERDSIRKKFDELFENHRLLRRQGVELQQQLMEAKESHIVQLAQRTTEIENRYKAVFLEKDQLLRVREEAIATEARRLAEDVHKVGVSNAAAKEAAEATSWRLKELERVVEKKDLMRAQLERDLADARQQTQMLEVSITKERAALHQCHHESEASWQAQSHAMRQLYDQEKTEKLHTLAELRELRRQHEAQHTALEESHKARWAKQSQVEWQLQHELHDLKAQLHVAQEAASAHEAALRRVKREAEQTTTTQQRDTAHAEELQTQLTQKERQLVHMESRLSVTLTKLAETEREAERCRCALDRALRGTPMSAPALDHHLTSSPHEQGLLLAPPPVGRNCVTAGEAGGLLTDGVSADAWDGGTTPLRPPPVPQTVEAIDRQETTVRTTASRTASPHALHKYQHSTPSPSIARRRSQTRATGMAIQATPHRHSRHPPTRTGPYAFSLSTSMVDATGDVGDDEVYFDEDSLLVRSPVVFTAAGARGVVRCRSPSLPPALPPSPKVTWQSRTAAPSASGAAASVQIRKAASAPVMRSPPSALRAPPAKTQCASVFGSACTGDLGGFLQPRRETSPHPYSSHDVLVDPPHAASTAASRMVTPTRGTVSGSLAGRPMNSTSPVPPDVSSIIAMSQPQRHTSAPSEQMIRRTVQEVLRQHEQQQRQPPSNLAAARRPLPTSTLASASATMPDISVATEPSPHAERPNGMAAAVSTAGAPAAAASMPHPTAVASARVVPVTADVVLNESHAASPHRTALFHQVNSSWLSQPTSELNSGTEATSHQHEKQQRQALLSATDPQTPTMPPPPTAGEADAMGALVASYAESRADAHHHMQATLAALAERQRRLLSTVEETADPPCSSGIHTPAVPATEGVLVTGDHHSCQSEGGRGGGAFPTAAVHDTLHSSSGDVVTVDDLEDSTDSMNQWARALQQQQFEEDSHSPRNTQSRVTAVQQRFMQYLA